MSTSAPPSEATTPAVPAPESVPSSTVAVKPDVPVPTVKPPGAAIPAQPKIPPPAVVHRPPVAVPAPAPASVTSTVSSKSSKKKKATSVTMATAPNQSGSGAQGENTGRWTAEEHRLFLQGLEQHGKGWKKIASLIKSRTVVQIRTHAQKYFQKIAKARQNGEDACDVTMEGRTSVGSVGATNNVAAQSNKRRRQITGTKRKAIQSVVSSAIRQGKKMAAAQAAAGVPDPVPPLPAVAPALAHFVLPQTASGLSSTATTTTQGNVSGAALEESLFRFLSPVAVASSDSQVNDVARQAGANPITLPSSQPSTAPSIGGGEISPTGVNDISIYPSWTDAKDPPSWYAKGGDVDALLDVADTLDWLADTGDPNETFQVPPPSMDEDSAADDIPDVHLSATAAAVDDSDDDDGFNVDGDDDDDTKVNLGGAGVNSTSVSTLPHVDSNVESVVPPLPALFEGASSDKQGPSATTADDAEEDNAAKTLTRIKSDSKLSLSHHHQHPSDPDMNNHLEVFDSPMEEHDFVTTILQQQDKQSSSDNLAWNFKEEEEMEMEDTTTSG